MHTKIRHCLLMIIFSVIVGVTGVGYAAAKHSPLPADQAFLFSATMDGHDKVIVNWRMAQGYYLYTKRTHFIFEPTAASATAITLPQGELKYDANLGRLEIYTGAVSVPIALSQHASSFILKVQYQGCSDGGFCYPPMQKNLQVNVNTQSITELNTPPATFTMTALLTHQQSVQALLGTQSISSLLLIFVGIGLLLSLTPCVLPMIPILTGIIIGQKNSVTTRKAFLLSLTYVFGSAIAYAMAGVAAAAMGSSLQVWLQKPLIIALISGLFVLLALSLFGCYQLTLPKRWQRTLLGWSNQQQRGSYVGVFLMGSLSALIVSPCVTAPLVGVLLYIAQTGDRFLGASALFAMGVGMGIPLLLIGVSAGKWLPKAGPWMEGVKKIFGLLMLAMALWLLSRIVSTTVIIMLALLMLLGILIYVGIVLSFNFRRMRYVPVMVLSLFGIAVVGAIQLPAPLSKWMPKNESRLVASTFTVVPNVSAFQKQLMLARARGKPVILDFYADWCESCVTMDKQVFNAKEVQNVLNNYVLLRADLSANNEADQAMLTYFHVIAPPTVLFFDASGNEQNAERIVGEVDAKEFLARLVNRGTTTD